MAIDHHDKVVILLATFNGERFLGDQLKSFVNQRYTNWDLIASDDGSTDGTLALLDRFRLNVPQHVSLTSGPGAGFWRNFLSLIHLDSAGDFFALSDQDDIWLPDKLTQAVRFLKTVSPAIPAVYFTRTQLIDDNNRMIGLSRIFSRPPCFKTRLSKILAAATRWYSTERPMRCSMRCRPTLRSFRMTGGSISS